MDAASYLRNACMQGNNGAKAAAILFEIRARGKLSGGNNGISTTDLNEMCENKTTSE